MSDQDRLEQIRRSMRWTGDDVQFILRHLAVTESSLLTLQTAVREQAGRWRETARNLRECLREGGVTDPTVINRLQLIAAAHESDADEAEALVGTPGA